MKKILHVSKYYYPFRGGTEQIARACVNALKNEYEQLVICFNDGPTSKNDEVEGVPVIRAGCIAKVASQGISPSYGKRLKRAIKEFKPDVIIFHYPNPYVAHYLLKYLQPSTKFIIYWHLDIVKQKLLKQLFKGQNRKLLKRADQLIATSSNYATGSSWLQKYKSKIVVIPNCIDEKKLICDERIRNRAQEIRKENDGKILCFAIGRHTEYKGYKYLIRAAHLLDDRFIICIGGKGEETEALKREANEDPKIRFLGFLEDGEMKAYLDAMDIFCFPSITKNEAFGVALAEGMYFGKPAITFNIPGSGVNYVNKSGETGMEVPNRDVKAYANALRRLADDAELRERYGTAARKRVQDLFMYQEYEKRVQRLIKKGDIRK